MILAFHHAGVRMAVDIEDDRVAGAVAETIPSWDDPTSSPTHVIRRDPEVAGLGHVWRRGPRGWIEPRGYWDPPESLAAMWESIESDAIERSNEPLLHAATVSVDERAVVLVAQSRGGKTTMALAVAAVGGEFLGDELLALRVGKVAPGVRPAHARPEAADPPVGWNTLRAGRHLLVLPPEPARPDARSTAAFVFLERTPGASEVIAPLTAAAVARRLIAASHNVTNLGWSGLGVVAAAARATPGYVLRYAEAFATATTVVDIERMPPVVAGHEIAARDQSWSPVEGRRAKAWVYPDSVLLVDGDRRWTIGFDGALPTANGSVVVPRHLAEEVDDLVHGKPW